jgi:hypothetical protein
MTVTFEPDDGKGTHVTLSGDVARGKHGKAADPEHWSERSADRRREAEHPRRTHLI